MTDQLKVEVTHEREFRAFAELSYAHWVILDNAKEKHEGWFYECLTANILAAFKVEAYFNHIGQKLWDDWGKKDRKWPKRKKFEKIIEKIGMQIPENDPLRKTLLEVFDFRDAVAHARTEHLSSRSVTVENNREELRRAKPLSSWEKQSDIEFVEHAYNDTESLIERIHQAGGYDSNDLYQGLHSYSIKRLH